MMGIRPSGTPRRILRCVPIVYSMSACRWRVGGEPHRAGPIAGGAGAWGGSTNEAAAGFQAAAAALWRLGLAHWAHGRRVRTYTQLAGLDRRRVGDVSQAALLRREAV